MLIVVRVALGRCRIWRLWSDLTVVLRVEARNDWTEEALRARQVPPK